jgi:hypothetical protein
MVRTPFHRRLILLTSFLGSVTLSFAINAPSLCLTAIAGDFAFDKAQSGIFHIMHKMA